MPTRPEVPRGRLPVIVLSGHLGAGKTTVLNHLLRTSGGRIGVVVNDFGQVNVDALLVHGQVDATAITGGCLCCLADTTELDDALERLARPALRLDAVVIEASGLAEPREIARMVLASEVRGIRFGGVVEVLDAAQWADLDTPPVALDHVRVASVIVLNKVDRAATDPADQVRALARFAPSTPVLPVEQGSVDPAFLLDIAEHEPVQGQLSLTDLLVESDHRDHAHARYDTLLLEPAPVHPSRLVDLLEHRPVGLYRAKGVLDVAGIERPVLVHAVGAWYALEPAPAGVPPTGLVVIGSGMDTDAVRARLDALTCAAGETPTVDECYAVQRHLRRRAAP